MKAIVVALALPVGFVLNACGSAATRSAPAKPTVPAPTTWIRPWSGAGVELPSWVHDPTQDGTVTGAFGAARPESGLSTDDLAAIAAGKARARLQGDRASTVEARILDVDDTRGAQRSVAVSDARVSGTVERTRQRALWIHPMTGEVFVWIVADP